jgi:hypothetical protein
LKKGDLGGFKNFPGEGIYGKRYKMNFANASMVRNFWQTP